MCKSSFLNFHWRIEFKRENTFLFFHLNMWLIGEQRGFIKFSACCLFPCLHKISLIISGIAQVFGRFLSEFGRANDKIASFNELPYKILLFWCYLLSMLLSSASIAQLLAFGKCNAEFFILSTKAADCLVRW